MVSLTCDFGTLANIILTCYIVFLRKIEMANMVDSKTVCFKYWDHGHYSYYKAQKGSGNSKYDLPWIILEDVKACNGIIHVIDEVMLPYH